MRTGYTHPRVESHDEAARRAHVGTWVRSPYYSRATKGQVTDAFWRESDHRLILRVNVTKNVSYDIPADETIPADPPADRLPMNPKHTLNIKE